uniref:Serine carboxypeptidase n=1 Tax=Angiostrongylus cantonensis TaxID=6313 RepID=A0A0K0DCQ5_ANGCA
LKFWFSIFSVWLWRFNVTFPGSEEGEIRRNILIYNGDVDTVFFMGLYILSGFFFQGEERVNEPWSYRNENPSIAGFQLKYEGGIDFLTVRGSGHFVPADKPRESLQMIYNFVTGQDYSLPVPF